MEEKLCMNCMQPLADEDTACPHCHYATNKQNPQGYLPAGSLLSDHYMVGRALGSYGDACIYIGYDKLLKERVYIREFFPADFCERTRDGSVVPVDGKEDAFDTCRESFLTNVRALAKLKDLPSLLPLYDIFDEHNTVYAVSDYCEGVSLARELKTRGRIPYAELRPLFMQLLSSLSTLHRAGVCHLAICPDTILIAPDGKLRLRSFAIPQARTTGSPIKPRLSAGFSAPEQYAPRRACGEAADVYGVAATLFCALTGNTPPEAPQRARGAQDLFLPAEVAEELPENVGLALFNALQPDPDKRIGTIEEFRQALTAEPAVNALLEDEEEEEEAAKKPAEKKNHYPLYIGIAVFVVLAVLAGILLMVLFPKTPTPSPSDTVPTTTTLPSKAPTTYVDPTNSYSIPSVVGKNYFTEKNNTMTGDFKLEVQYMQYDKSKAKGVILSQEPVAGTAAAAETVIKVVISMGSEELSVPDVAGWPQEYAVKYLEALGFKVDVLTVNVSTYEKGLCEGTDPVKGTKLSVGDTVTLRVSNMEKTEPSADMTDGDTD